MEKGRLGGEGGKEESSKEKFSLLDTQTSLVVDVYIEFTVRLYVRLVESCGLT